MYHHINSSLISSCIERQVAISRIKATVPQTPARPTSVQGKPPYTHSQRSTSKGMDERRNNQIITCDACLRSSSLCIGYPVCERCSLHELECIYSPGEEQLSELRDTFKSLLLPGQEISPSHALNPLTISSPPATMDSSNVVSCVVCVHLGKPCGGETPKCKQCGDEGFLCVYENQGSEESRGCFQCARDGLRCIHPGPSSKSKACYNCQDRNARCDFQFRELKLEKKPCTYCRLTSKVCDEVEGGCGNCSADRVDCWYGSSRRPILAEDLKSFELAKEAQDCDTCKIWRAYCDSEKPSCSTCQVRGVQCSYSNPSFTARRRPNEIPVSNFPSNLPPPPSFPRTNRHNAGSPASSSARWPKPPTSSPDYRQFSKPSISEMYSTPSGCISCFNSKSKCVPLTYTNSERLCERCFTRGIDCKPFAPGTKLIACDACMTKGTPCTNSKQGLRCDGCVEAGKSCSRAGSGDGDDGAYVDPPLLGSNKAQSSNSTLGRDTRTCNMCLELHQFCDGIEPACALCKEVGLTCVYKQTPTQADDGALDIAGNLIDLPIRGAERRDEQSTNSNGRGVSAGPENASNGSGIPERQIQAVPVNQRFGSLENAPYYSTTALITPPGQKPKDSTTILVTRFDPPSTGTGPWVPTSKEIIMPTLGLKEKGTPEIKQDNKLTDGEKPREGADSADEWEEITHADALGPGKPGEFGIVEMDD